MHVGTRDYSPARGISSRSAGGLFMNQKNHYYKMPKKFFRRKPKTTIKRKFIRKRRIARIPRLPRITGVFRNAMGMQPFAPRKNCKLSYTHTNLLTTGVGGIYGTEQVFRLNSLYDLDFSGAGHQPYGYDQVAALYNLYCVRGVKIQMVISDPSADGVVVAASVQPSNSTFAITGQGVDAIKEQPFSITRSINNSGKQVQTITSYVPIQTIEGLTRTQFAGALSIYQAGITNNPSRVPYLRIACGSLRGNQGDTVLVRTTLTFYSQFSDRVIQTQS